VNFCVPLQYYCPYVRAERCSAPTILWEAIYAFQMPQITHPTASGPPLRRMGINALSPVFCSYGQVSSLEGWRSVPGWVIFPAEGRTGPSGLLGTDVLFIYREPGTGNWEHSLVSFIDTVHRAQLGTGTALIPGCTGNVFFSSSEENVSLL